MHEIVKVGTGQLRGSVEGGVARFLGVPYAAPSRPSCRERPVSCILNA